MAATRPLLCVAALLLLVSGCSARLLPRRQLAAPTTKTSVRTINNTRSLVFCSMHDTFRKIAVSASDCIVQGHPVSRSMVGGADVDRWFRYDTERLSCNSRTCKFLHAPAACLIMRQVHLCLDGSSAFMTRR